MDYTKYKVIQTMKQSDKAEILFAAVEGLDKPVVVKRLFEANPDIYYVIKKIKNLHIPQIYHVEARENELLVVEEYIDGRTLDIYLEETQLTDVQKLGLMLQLCEALEVLHGCNPSLIHRDIKPSNLLVNEDGVLKIIDFDASRQYKKAKNTSDTRLLGTIEYAAPEQFGYAQTDFRSDIYSAGVVFSEIAIDEKSAFAKEWKRLVDKCTSFDPENRFKDVPELKKELIRCVRKEPKAKRRWILVLTASILLVMLSVGGVLLCRGKVTSSDGNQVTSATNSETGDDDMEHIMLNEDRIYRENDGSSVFIELKENVSCKIVKVYTCEQGDEGDVYSEMLIPVEEELYVITENGKKLELLPEIFKYHKTRDEDVLYVEFDNGNGERVWITSAEPMN